MSENRGIFSLEEFYDLQVSGETSKILDVFRYVNQAVTTAHPYGYMRAGNADGIERIDFNNDTAAISPQYTTTGTSNHWESNFGNVNYGYITGGRGDSPSSYPSNWGSTSIRRLDYSNDTGTMESKGPFAIPRYNHAGVGNNDYGYSIAGRDFGYPGPNIYYSDIFRTDYSNDTVTPPVKSNYPFQNGNDFGLSGTGNMNYGWISGGKNGRSTVCRIDYASDTTAPTIRGYLNRYGENGRKATGNSSYGYWQSKRLTTRFSRLDFSNDTDTSVDKGTSHAAYNNGAVTSKDYSYLYGYYYPYSSILERMDYSNDEIAASPKGPMASNGGGGTHCAGVSAQQFGLPTAPVPATRTESGVTSVPNFGYAIAGQSSLSLVDRIDYANDTATAAVKGSLSQTFQAHQSTSNPTHAYVAAGYPSPSKTSVDRIEFANDTATGTPKGPLSAGRQYYGATGNASFGYYAGGAPSVISSVDRIDYSSDTSTASPKGPLSFAKGNSQGCGNLSFGYFAGGDGNKSSVDRIDYSSDTSTASPKGNLENSRSTMVASGTSDFGYWSGGYPYYTKASRIDYSSDTSTAVAKAQYPSTVTPYGFSNAAGTGSNTHGYAFGGNGAVSYVWRIDYTNDTADAVSKGPLSLGRIRFSAASPLENGLPSKSPGTVDKGADGYAVAGALGPAYGYFSGGYNPSNSPAHPSFVYYSNVDRVDFASDTSTASPKGKLDQARSNAGAAGSLSHGYIGASDLTSGYTSIVARVDYANDSATAVVKGSMTPGTDRYQAATSNTSYGWFSGGQPGGSNSKVQRIDFSNDDTTASPRGNLSLSRQALAGAGNANYGWHAGGYNWPAPDYIRSVVDRIDYSNDSATATPKGNLSVKRRALGATGNADYGYYSGGYNVVPGGNNWVSNIDRIDYSNDTPTATPKGNLSQPRSRGTATGNTSYGYAVGGEGSNNDGLSTVDRIDFANDTATAATKGPLTYTARGYSGFSAQANALQGTPSFIPRIRWVDSASQVPAPSVGPAFAYFGGGAPGPLSSTERLNYNNDTATASPKGPLSSAKYGAASTGSTTHGYWGAGSPHPGISTVDRIDYSNDTGAASVRGPLSESTYMQGAMSSLTHGYWHGGVDKPSRVDRVDFSNDTATATPVGNLDHPNYNYNPGAAGNLSYGYVIGGTNAATSKVTRIDFSNDTATPAPVGNLSQKNTSFGTAGNANFAYTGGGEPGVYTSIVNRIEYANDTATALVKGPLTSVKTRVTASGNANFGYWVGGATPTVLTTIDRIDYANDTVTATPKGNLGTPRRFMGTAGASAKANAYPQEAVSAPVQPPFPYPEQLPAPGPAYGYWGAGKLYTDNTADSSTIDRINFSNDTATAVVKGSLTATKYNQGGATGNISYGYFGAGGPSTLSRVERVDYSNDTATASERGNLDRSANNLDATGNASYGYWGGGWGPSPKSLVSRVDFSNDSATAAPKGNLTYSQYGAGAAGNQSYGYFAGGENTNVSNVSKIDYSNDTATATAVGNLSAPKAWMGAVANSDYGYFAGSNQPSPLEFKSTVDRIDFSNDTPTTSPKGTISTNRGYFSGTSSPAYGYVGGGQETGGPSSPITNLRTTVDRIDFSNDTATAVAKGPLTQARRILGATGARMNGLP